jgi:D-2-hydroxyacid dehydrogenase (NADP+)
MSPSDTLERPPVEWFPVRKVKWEMGKAGERLPKANLLILDKQADEYKRALKPKFPEVRIHAAISEKEVGDFISKAHIILTFKISDGLLQRASNLRWIQALATGVDALVRLPSLKQEVLLTSTRGIHGPQMSEMAVLLMLALNRKFPEIVRNQDKGVWKSWPAELLYRKKVGILGLGVTGEAIARKCKSFGMVVYGVKRSRKELTFVDHVCGPEDLIKVAREVDFLIIAVPSTSETYRMVGAEVLSSMKHTAFLINLARGEIVDEEALISALESEKIAGAALDVFCQEPLPQEHPFWRMKNVIITPHMGGTSTIYVDQALSIFEKNLWLFLKGETQNLINLVEH